MCPEKDEEIVSKWLKEAQKGYMRMSLLILMSNKPHHGYEMMKEVEDRTEGFWKPTAGGIYPTLRRLENEGYIKGKWDPQKKRKRKIYTITRNGRRILEQALLKQSQIASSMNSLFEEYASEVLGLDTKKSPMPQIPNPFSVFLDENHENKLETLKIKRSRIKQIIKMLQNELGNADKKIGQLSQQRDTTRGR